MNKTRHLISSAAISAAALIFVPNVIAADPPAKTTAGQPIAHPLGLPAGVQVKNLTDANGIRAAFKAVADASVNKDIYDDVVDRLVDADRTRIGKSGEKDFKDLQARVLMLQKQWKDKYGNDFKVDAKAVFAADGYIAIAQGEITDPAQIVGKWPLAPVASADAQTAGARQRAEKSAAADTAQQTRDAGKFFGGDANLNKGRDVAVAQFPASDGMPELTLSLIRELPDKWRFDIPDNVDGKTLHANLLKQLEMLGDGSKWPADENAAYRIVARRVLMAIYNVDASHESSPHDGK